MAKWASVRDAKTGQLVSIPQNAAAEIQAGEKVKPVEKIAKDEGDNLVVENEKSLPVKKEVSHKVLHHKK